MSKEEYLAKEIKRVSKLYNNKKGKLDFSFTNKQEFVEWFKNELVASDFKCNYCKTSIFDIQKLVDNELLATRRTGKGGTGQRGYNLEVERKDNTKGYSAQNCTVICYLCNNDKSSVVNSDDYLKFMASSRHLYIEHLKNQL